MPQLEWHFYIPQVFWLFVSFLLLWGGMHWFVVPLMKAISLKRKEMIDGLIGEARTLKQQADLLLEEDKKILQEVQKRAEKMIYDAQQQHQQKYLNYKVLQEEVYQKKLKEFEKKMEENKLSVLKEVRNIIDPLEKTVLNTYFSSFQGTDADFSLKNSKNGLMYKDEKIPSGEDA